MATVLVHATVSMDGFMAEEDGGMGWMLGFEATDADMALVTRVQDEVGAIVGGANAAQTIEDGEEPYGGALQVPVFLMTRTAHEPIERNGTTYTFVVDDIARAVALATAAAGSRSVALLGGSISRQCLERGLVDEIQLHVLPVLLGRGIPLFGGLDHPVRLERIETEAWASETHLRFRVVRTADPTVR